MTPAQYLLLGLLRAEQLAVLTPLPYGLVWDTDTDTVFPIKRVALKTLDGLTIVCGEVATEGSPSWAEGAIMRHMTPTATAAVTLLITDCITELVTRTGEASTAWAAAYATAALDGGTAIDADIETARDDFYATGVVRP